MRSSARNARRTTLAQARKKAARLGGRRSMRGSRSIESQRSGLNRRPPDYESGALPLSYCGDDVTYRVACMPWRGLEPRRLSAPPPQDGVSTNFTTRAFTGESGMANRESKEPRHAREARHWRVVIFRLRFPIPYSRFPLVPTGLTGLEPATSGVTDRHSNQLSYSPNFTSHCLTTPDA